MAYERRDGDGEVWLPVLGSDAYEVSSIGRVRRAVAGKSTSTGKVLSGRPRKRDGYIPVVLSMGRRGIFRQALVHHLVAEAFLGPKPSPLHCVAHNDGNPQNNIVTNLRWATHAENMADMSFARHGTSTFGEKSTHAKLTARRVMILRSLRDFGPPLSVNRAALRWGVSAVSAREAARGKTWKHLEIIDAL